MTGELLPPTHAGKAPPTPAQQKRRRQITSAAGVGLIAGVGISYFFIGADRNNAQDELTAAQACLSHVEQYGATFTTTDIGDKVLQNCGVTVSTHSAHGDSELASFTIELPTAAEQQDRVDDAQEWLNSVGPFAPVNLFVTGCLTAAGAVVGNGAIQSSLRVLRDGRV